MSVIFNPEQSVQRNALFIPPLLPAKNSNWPNNGWMNGNFPGKRVPPCLNCGPAGARNFATNFASIKPIQ